MCRLASFNFQPTRSHFLELCRLASLNPHTLHYFKIYFSPLHRRQDSPNWLAFTTSSSSIAPEQSQGRTQIPSASIKPGKYQQHNLYVAPLFLQLQSQHIQPNCVADPLNEAVQERLCGNLPITDMATHCSTSGSDMIYSYGIVDQDGSHRGDCSPSNFTKDCQVDVEGSGSRDNFIPFQLCEILEVHQSYSSFSFVSSDYLVCFGFQNPSLLWNSETITVHKDLYSSLRITKYPVSFQLKPR